MTAGAQVSFYRRAKDALATPGLPEKISERPPGSWPVVTPHLRVSPTARPHETKRGRFVRASSRTSINTLIRFEAELQRRGGAALGCDGRRCGSDRHGWRAAVACD